MICTTAGLNMWRSLQQHAGNEAAAPPRDALPRRTGGRDFWSTFASRQLTGMNVGISSCHFSGESAPIRPSREADRRHTPSEIRRYVSLLKQSIASNPAESEKGGAAEGRAHARKSCSK